MFVMRVVVGIVLYLLFWGTCYMATGTDKKNIGGFRSYPDEVQNRVRQDEELGKIAPKNCPYRLRLFLMCCCLRLYSQ